MYTKIHREGVILRLILILSLAGFALSGYLTYVHFHTSEGICPITGRCYEVWVSPYSTVLGLPVALIGLIGFLIIFALSFMRLYYPDLGIVESFPTYILLFAIAGTAFSSYLTVIEVFVIYAICDLCFTAFLLIIAVLGLISYGVIRGEASGPSVSPPST